MRQWCVVTTRGDGVEVLVDFFDPVVANPPFGTCS
jgi:hypothetical protein